MEQSRRGFFSSLLGRFLDVSKKHPITSEDIWIRQLIWTEYRAGNDKKQARINIKAKFRHKSVSKSAINRWYKRFGNLFISPVDQYHIPLAIQTLTNGDQNNTVNSFLLRYDDYERHWPFIFIRNERLMIRFYKEYKNNEFIFHDLFRGEKKTLPIDIISVDSVRMISDQYLLIRSSNLISFWKIDYESWKIDFVSQAILELQRYKIVVEEGNKNRFLICDSIEFVTGSLVNDEIVLSPVREHNVKALTWPKLSGNKLIGLRSLDRENDEGVLFYEFCIVDLDRLTEETVEIPLILNDGRSIPLKAIGRYCWAGNMLYFDFTDFFMHHSESRIISFDSDTLILKDTGITVYDNILNMFVDENHILTLHVVSSPFPCKSIYYRFCLRSPDTLRNIAWLTIRREAMLFGQDKYERIADRFFRPLFVCDKND